MKKYELIVKEMGLGGYVGDNWAEIFKTYHKYEQLTSNADEEHKSKQLIALGESLVELGVENNSFFEEINKLIKEGKDEITSKKIIYGASVCYFIDRIKKSLWIKEDNSSIHHRTLMNWLSDEEFNFLESAV